MQITVRGVLLIGAVALIALKLAGVLTWPWLAILVPALVYLAPLIFAAACIAATIGLGLLVMIGVGIAAALGSIMDYAAVRRRRKARMAEIAAGAEPGLWDVRL